MDRISGAGIASEIKSRLKDENLRDGLRPCLALILVGSQEESLVYVSLKEKALQAIGGRFHLERISEKARAAELYSAIQKLNEDPGIDGIILQLPLPEHLDPDREGFLAAINPEKDVDGFHPANRGLLLNGQPPYVSCAALACLEVIQRYAAPLESKKAVLIGSSFDLVLPLALLLTHKRCRVLVLPGWVDDALEGCDLAVVEEGRAGLIRSLPQKGPGLLIDAGFFITSDGLQGNADAGSLASWPGHLLPVPGGLGPILIAKLMDNLCQAARRRA